jgi:TRAP-type C4-dicarboxylate transport system permease small subunit
MITLIPQWKQAWKYLTVIGSGLLSVLSGLVAYANAKENLPEILSFLSVFKISQATYTNWVIAAGFVLALFRIIQQKIKVPPEVKAENVQVAAETPVTGSVSKPLTPISPEPPQ